MLVSAISQPHSDLQPYCQYLTLLQLYHLLLIECRNFRAQKPDIKRKKECEEHQPVQQKVVRHKFFTREQSPENVGESTSCLAGHCLGTEHRTWTVSGTLFTGFLQSRLLGQYIKYKFSNFIFLPELIQVKLT